MLYSRDRYPDQPSGGDYRGGYSSHQPSSYDRGGYNQGGGYDHGGYDRGGYDRGGYDRGSYDRRAYDRGGYGPGGPGSYGRGDYGPQHPYPDYGPQDDGRGGYGEAPYDYGYDGGYADPYPPDDGGYDYGQYPPSQGPHSQSSHGGYGGYRGPPGSSGPPPGYGGSRPRRPPPPRPPASRSHGQVPLAEDEFQQDDEERGMDPMGARRLAAEGRGGARSEAGGEDGEGAVADPALVAQRLSKVRDARKEAARGPAGLSGNFARPSVNDMDRPPPAPQWKCGPSRVKLRNQFNRKEIDVATLMNKYDTNHDWKLEQDEFLNLLQDYNHWFQHISKEEVEMVLQLADFDHDECIEPNEVLYGLRVWFAYVSMSGTVGQAIGHLSDCAMPAPEVLKEAMLVMNEEHPVDMEEAEYVRHIALAIGGTEQRVTSRQMRMAIAAWYLHIERKETANGELVKHAIGSTHERLCLQNPIQRCLRGQWDVVTLWLNGLFAFAWMVVPGLCIWVGSSTNTAEYPCERPMLSGMITATGMLALVHCACILWLTSAWECRAMKRCKWAAGVTMIVATVMLMMCWFLGLWQILTVRPANCGFIIYELGHFVWIGCPAISSVFLCCCIPCIYCHEYCKHRTTDQELMGHTDGSGAE